MDAKERLLFRNGAAVAISPKAFDLLLALVERPGKLRTRRELLDLIWNDTAIEEGTLSRHVSDLRRALGDDRETTRYIETVSKRGYRFLLPAKEAAVESLPGAAAGESGIPRRLPQMRIALAGVALALLAVAVYLALDRANRASLNSPRSLAVAPVTVINPVEGDDALRLGLADALIHRLGGAAGLAVRPLGDSWIYASGSLEAAHKMGAEALLETTMQNGGASWRVRSRLSLVTTGAVLWEDQFDESRDDLLALEDRIAERVAVSLRVRLTVAERRRLVSPDTTQPEALQEYVIGRSLWTQRTEAGVRRSITHFDRATALDSHYALAWSGLADAWQILVGYGWVAPREGMPVASQAATKAVALRPDRAEPHATLALIAENYDRDFRVAEREDQTAISLDPNYATARHWYGEYLGLLGRVDEGLAELRAARQLNPASLTIPLDMAKILAYSGHLDEAMVMIQTVLEIDPDQVRGKNVLLMILNRKKDPRRRALLDDTVRLNSPQDAVLVRACYGSEYEPGAAIKRAVDELAGRKQSTWPWAIAESYACLGEADRAFDWMEETLRQRATGPMELRMNPLFDKVRGQARYQAVLREAGF